MTTDNTITKAVTILREGGLVAFPTETVYGLGADACNEAAIRRIFQAKERPYDHPLIVHIAHLEQMKDWARDIPPAAMRLAHAFWPGPLTLILKKQPHVLDIVTGGQPTIGLRIPRHPVAQVLLHAFGGGVAAPSANRFTHISPTTAADVQEELHERVDLILDGGACEVGLESTIIDMTGEHPVILRPGMITPQALENVLGKQVVYAKPHQSEIRTPGMHHLHYAPTTHTSLIAVSEIPAFAQALTEAAAPVAVMIRSHLAIVPSDKIKWIKMPVEAAAYAHDLYHTLRALDNQPFKQIVIEAVPETAEWDAVRDRLFKASAKR